MTDTQDPMFAAGQALHRYASSQDRAALEQCLSACLQPAYRQAYAALGNDADAQDATQEALLQLTRSADRYQPERPLAPWLARHVVYACAHLRRSAARRRQREDMAMREQLRLHESDKPSNDEQRAMEKVRAAVDQLKEKDRAIISMHYFAGLSQAETAAALGITENTASVRIHRARNKLKSILERQGLTAGLAVLPMLASAAPQAPAALLPQVMQCCTASVLPATTISLTILEKGMMLMQTHPLMSAVSAVLLSLLTTGGALLIGAEKETPPKTPIVEQVEVQPAWNQRAEKVLGFHNPDALVQFASDGVALREMLLSTKPFSYFRSEEAQRLIPQWYRTLKHYRQWNQRESELLMLFETWLAHQGTLLQVDNPPYDVLWAVDAGSYDETLKKFLTHDKNKTNKTGSYQHFGERVAIDGTTVVFTPQSAFHLPNAHDPALEQYPIWLNINPKHLIEQLREVEGLPYDLDKYLGKGWQERQIQVAAHIERIREEMVLRAQIDDLPVSFLWLGAVIIAEELYGIYDLPVVPLRMRSSKKMPAIDATALGAMRFACDYAEHSDLKLYLAECLDELCGLGALAEHWDGTACIQIQNGIPFPYPEIVLGLDQNNQDSLSRALSKMCVEIGAQEGEALKGYKRLWNYYSPLRALQIALAEDRLVIGRIDRLPGLLNSAPESADMEIQIDLPKLAQSYLPMLWPMLPRITVPDDDMRIWHAQSLIKSKVRSAVSRGKGIEEIYEAIIKTRQYAAWLDVEESELENYPVADYLSIWQGNFEQNGRSYEDFQFIFRSEDGWYYFRDPQYNSSVCYEDMNEILRQLSGKSYTHIAGATLENLKNHPRGPVPQINTAKDIPSVLQIVKHMPKYQLIYDYQANGRQVLKEHGLPLMGFLFAGAGFGLTGLRPEQEAREFAQQKKKALFYNQNRGKVQALQRLAKAMLGKNWQQPADVLKHMSEQDQKVLGFDQGTASINAIGVWLGQRRVQTQVCTTSITADAMREEQAIVVLRWMIPLADGVWGYVGLHGKAGFTIGEPLVQGRSYTEQQKRKRPVKKEQAPVHEDIEF